MIGDVLLDLYERMWANQPDNTILGEQNLLISAASWDTPKMVASSRKMFNLTKAPTWARVAAWAEWADVSFRSSLLGGRSFYEPSKSYMAHRLGDLGYVCIGTSIWAKGRPGSSHRCHARSHTDKIAEISTSTQPIPQPLPTRLSQPRPAQDRTNPTIDHTQSRALCRRALAALADPLGGKRPERRVGIGQSGGVSRRRGGEDVLADGGGEGDYKAVWCERG